eukprot:scaffold11103_cov117-Cylindrotheca_fusiformis.AAC.1
MTTFVGTDAVDFLFDNGFAESKCWGAWTSFGNPICWTVDEALGGDWASRKNKIGEVVRKYAQKEILSLLELCLWKVKIGEASTSKKAKIGEATSKKAKIGEATSKKEEHILANRRRCRVMSGADVVIPHVLPFLDN